MSTTNYSFYAVPAMWVISFLPHAWAANYSNAQKDLPNFDNTSPRAFIAKVAGQEKQSEAVKKYLRAEGANNNGYENLPLFGLAIVAANFAGVPVQDLNLLTGSYLVSRVLYTILYINTTSEIFSYVRSVTFVSGVGICFTLFIKAGNLLNKSS